MSNPYSIVPNRSVKYLDALMLDEQRRLRPVSSAALYQVDPTDLKLWCHHNAVYGIPTHELVGWIRDRIGGRSAIEIGSGNGCLGRALGIPRTDSRLQEQPEMKAFYAFAGQPVITYGEDVERLEALEAVTKYKPQVVVGQWVTQWTDPTKPEEANGSIFGVRENLLLEQVETYIMVGNSTVHGTKQLIQQHPPEMIRAHWIWSRSAQQNQNFILIWDRR